MELEEPIESPSTGVMEIVGTGWANPTVAFVTALSASSWTDGWRVSVPAGITIRTSPPTELFRPSTPSWTDAGRKVKFQYEGLPRNVRFSGSLPELRIVNANVTVEPAGTVTAVGATVVNCTVEANW